MSSVEPLVSNHYFAAPACAALLALITVYSIHKRYNKFRAVNPISSIPSLPHVPVLGSLPYLTTVDKFYLFLTSKAQEYGSVFSFYVFSEYTVVLNGYEALRDALVKRSSDYAGRAKLYTVDKVWADSGRGLILGQYGPEYRRKRSHSIAVLKSFGYGQQNITESKISHEIEHLLSYLRSREHEAWYPAHILEFTAMNIIYNLMFSDRFDYDDPSGQFIQKSTKVLMDSSDVVYDLLPIITYLPNVWRYMSSVRKTYDELLSCYEKRIEECKNKPTVNDNFIQEYMKQLKEGEKFDRRELAVILRDLILAGTETTSSQLNWALIMMANNPECQRRVQAEIDSVMSGDRLPSLVDRIRLPYVEATILEVMRIRTAGPLSIPHVTTTETEVLGHQIPAKTTVIANLWSAHMDPNYWPEPEKFNPERFLDDQGKVCKRDLVIPFSLGKRQCLGELLARQEMFLIFSSILQRFNILPPDGENRVKDKPVFIRALTAEPHLMRIVPRQNPVE